MPERATGTFAVQLEPLAGGEEWGAFARMSIDKRFSGGLDGTSRGQMVAAHTAVKGSAGYVALERVTGTLAGRSGSFVLQHYGFMRGGKPSLDVAVVPDSGTDGLVGLDGTMKIIVDGGEHRYELAYSLPVRPE